MRQYFNIYLIIINIIVSICLFTRAQAEPVAQQTALQIGILPISTTRTLIKNYEPLHNYLEKMLNRPVELVTAHDFKTFHFNTLEGQYDLIVTAAHLGRLAQTQANFVPLARYKAQHRTQLVMAKDQPLKSVEELRGKKLAGIDPITLAMNESMLWLRGHGLQAGKDFTILESPTPVSAGYAVKNHQAVLAVSSIQGMKHMPEELRQSLEVFTNLPELPSLLWLAHPRMKDNLDKIKSALMAFTPELPEGQQFFEATGYQGLREVNNQEMTDVEHTAQEVKKLLVKPK